MALTPATVLRLLAGAGTVGDGDRHTAVVAVHLAGGQVLEGHLLRVDDDHGHEVALLAGATTGHVSYLLTATVVAVTVHAPEDFQDVLTGGALPPPLTGVPPGRLELRRDYPPTPEFPLQLDWAALPGSAEAMANLAQLLAALREAGQEVRVEEFGRQAWEQVRALRVEHEPGQQLTVERVPDGLAVRTDLTAALPPQLAGELRQQLNALL